MPCPDCGGDVDADATVCSHCGFEFGGGDETERSLEQMLRGLSPRQLVAVVRRVWAERGSETRPVEHDGSLYVQAVLGDDRRELIQVGVSAAFSTQVADDLESLRKRRGFERAYFVSTDDATAVGVESPHVEHLDLERVVTTVRRLNLEGFLAARSETVEDSAGAKDASASTPSGSDSSGGATERRERQDDREREDDREQQDEVGESTARDDPGGQRDTGESDGDSVSRAERAARIISQAAGDSVTERRLLETGSPGLLTMGILHDAPLIDHLETDERPQFLFRNDAKGITSAANGRTTPDDDYRTLIAVTDRRVLVVVGQDDGDETTTIPYESVTSVGSATGLTKHRVTVETTDDAYDLYVSTGSVDEESEIGDAATFIDARITETAPPDAATEGAGSASADEEPVREPSEEANDEPNEEAELTTGEAVGVAVGFVAVVAVLGAVVVMGAGMLTDDTGTQPLVSQHADELVLSDDQLGSEWSQVSANSVVFDGADNHSSAAFVNREESVGGVATAITAEVYVFSSVNESRDAYTARVEDLESQYTLDEDETADGSPAVFYSHPRDPVTVRVVQERNTIVVLRYQEYGFESVRKIELGGFTGTVLSNYED